VTRKSSAELCAAFLSLDELEGVELQLPPEWSKEREQWLLKLELQVPLETPQVPRTTDWVVLVDDTYPLGKIDFLPAVTERGLQATFPHQRANTRDPKLPFRCAGENRHEKVGERDAANESRASPIPGGVHPWEAQSLRQAG